MSASDPDTWFDLTDQERAAALKLASELEHRKIRLGVAQGVTDDEAQELAQAWLAGYRQAIERLRVIGLPTLIPDDLRELDAG